MQRGFAPILVLIGVILAITVVLVTTQTSYLSNIYPKSIPQITNQPLPTQVLSPTAIWKEINFDKLQFKIPSTWDSRKYLYNSPKAGVSYLLSPSPLPDNSDAQPAIVISHQYNTTVSSQREEIIKGYYLANVTEKVNSISDVSGVLIEGTIQIPSGIDVPIPDGQIVHQAIFQVDKDLYSISEIGSQYENEFKQILSTFKFTDQTTDTSDWKILSTSDYMIKYPNTWQIKDQNGGGNWYEIYDPTSKKTRPTNGNGTISYFANSISIYSVKSTETTKQFVDKAVSGPEYTGVKVYRKTLIINNLPAELYTASGEGSSGYLIAATSGKMVAVINVPVADPSSDSMINTILSSFKFTK